MPLRIRQALNVEAGLNDGLSVPFLLFFIALATAGGEGGTASLMRFILDQLGLGVLVGVAIGLAGGWLLAHADRKEWMADSFRQVGLVALPVLCLLGSEMAGASMFIAAFVAGLAVQIGFRDVSEHSLEFAEEWGQVLNSVRVLPLRPVGGATMAADRRGGGAVRGAQPDRRADVAGRASRSSARG